MIRNKKAKRMIRAAGLFLLILVLSGLLYYLRPHFKRTENTAVRNYYYSDAYKTRMPSVINDYLSEDGKRADKPKAVKPHTT